MYWTVRFFGGCSKARSIVETLSDKSPTKDLVSLLIGRATEDFIDCKEGLSVAGQLERGAALNGILREPFV
jgi:hypothetical protein